MIVSNTNRWIMLEPLAMVDSVSPPPPSSSYTSYPYSNFNPSMSIVVVMLFFAFFFMAYLSLYIRQCYENSSEPSNLRFTASTIRRPKRGLEQSVSNSFPIFCYGEIKEQRIGREVLECAVCLGEFGKEDSVKLMPKCCHVFHRECIDTWLACHITCPVCRADLDRISGEGLIERAEQINMSRLEIISGNESILEQVGNQVHQC